ncbi:MAG TPA: glycosyl hydrolase family 17 protein, partial [Rhodanobacter sp.]
MSATATNHDSRYPLLTAIVLALVVAAMNIGLWWWGNLPHGPDDWHGKIGGFAFSSFQRYQDPIKHDFPSDEEIDRDLKLVARYSDRIRTYSMQINPQTYRLAEKDGLQVMAGAEIDTRLENNEKEIDTLIAMARRYPKTITRVIVGNEVLFRNDLKPEQMMLYLDRVRAAVHQPVSIAEPEYIWLKYPELADHVDFITIHIFPFWNGFPVSSDVDKSVALNAALGSYQTLQQRFPNKHIVVGEIGWPSNGDRHEHADPSISNEAIFIREWLIAAKQHDIDYYLMEAFDQPWKEQLSGRTEAYWGIFNA